MSRLTTSAIKVTPPAAIGLSVSPNTTAWLDGDWVEFIDETIAADTAIAGVNLQDDDAWANLHLEVEFGIGTLGAEVPIGHLRIHGQNSGNGGPAQYLIPFPISGIPVGSRVCIRFRANTTGTKSWLTSLLYYEDCDSDQVVPYTLALLTSYPAGANSIEITASTTPWDDSDWEEFAAEVGEQSYVFAVLPEDPAAGVDAEIDVGTGGIGAEIALTTVRFGAYEQEGRFSFVNLPGLMPIPIGSRLVGRLRKSGTAANTVSVAFLGYASSLVPPIPPHEGGVIGPLVIVEWPRFVPGPGVDIAATVGPSVDITCS